MSTWYEYMINAAEHSKFSAEHWFRYLRKVIFENESYLNAEDIENLMSSSELTNFQKISLKYATKKNTPTHEYVISLNKPAKLSNIEKIKEKYNYD